MPASVPLVENVQAHLDGLKKFERAQKLELLDKHEMQLVGSSALFTKDRYYDPLERASWVDEIVFTSRSQTLYRLELECRADQLTRFEPVFTLSGKHDFSSTAKHEATKRRAALSSRANAALSRWPAIRLLRRWRRRNAPDTRPAKHCPPGTHIFLPRDSW